MDVIININRTKISNKIVETFSVYPQHHFLLDESRAVRKVIRRIINRKSIADKFRLLSSNEDKWSVVNEYEYKDGFIPELNETIKFIYNPVLGEKRCSKCFYFRKVDKSIFCIFRGKKLREDYWHKCQHWSEHRWKEI